MLPSFLVPVVFFLLDASNTPATTHKQAAEVGPVDDGRGRATVRWRASGGQQRRRLMPRAAGRPAAGGQGLDGGHNSHRSDSSSEQHNPDRRWRRAGDDEAGSFIAGCRPVATTNQELG